jgi:nucleoid-associated protein YgaU
MAADAAAADPMAADGAAADPFAAPAGDVASESVPTTDGAAAPMVSTPAAAGGYVPENGSKMAYYVQKGDTLGSIAQKILGSKAKWQELAQANNLQDPNKIYAGDALYYTLSDASRGFADQYEGAARQTVSVGQGDTLSTISDKVFGSQGSWRTLWKENPQVTNPDRIFPGQTLFYRAGAAATAEAPMSYDEGVATQE